MAMIDKALWYTRKGLAVFPLTTIEDGRCTCGKACSSPGKHPLGDAVPHGCLDATTDEGAITQWWALYPDANIGIATGEISGLVVVDIDEDHGGWDAIENLIERHGDLPQTWVAETGGGGGHFYFQMPPCEIRNSAGVVGPGIDIRAQNGYVVAAPSIHVSGKRYRWTEDGHPQRAEIAPLPDWLYLRIMHDSRQAGQQRAAALPPELSQGQRNNWLTSIAGTMRHRGCSADAIYAALNVENKDRCKPPLNDREIRLIARSIERYPPAQESTVTVRHHA